MERFESCYIPNKNGCDSDAYTASELGCTGLICTKCIYYTTNHETLERYEKEIEE